MRSNIRAVRFLPLACALLMSPVLPLTHSPAFAQEKPAIPEAQSLTIQLNAIKNPTESIAIISKLTGLAAKGDAEANQALGDLFSTGGGGKVTIDGEMALQYYRASAAAGNAWGHLRLGELYRDGTIVKADAAQAFENFRKASDMGLAMGTMRLGEAYLEGIGTAIDTAKGLSLLEGIASGGDPWANQRLGDFYSSSKAADGEKAVRYYQAAANAGNAWAFLRLGELQSEGKIVKADPAEAFGNFQRAADAGLAIGKLRVGEAYIDGKGTAIDTARGAALLAQASDGGDPWAGQRLGDLYSRGGGNIAIDGEKAVRYYLSAAKAGNSWGYLRLGELYSEGTIVKADPAEAFHYFQRAADAGLAMGRIRLAQAHIKGMGTPVDTARGISILEKAASDGDSWASQALGDFYSSGGAIDGRKAIEYYQASAKAGNAWGFLRLGEIYRDGLIVKADNAQAFANFKKAAEAGLAMGKVRLGEAYLQGIGVAANRKKGIALIEEGSADQDKWSLQILADYLSRGEYARPDLQGAISIYEKAGKAGNGYAYMRLGEIYSDKTSLLHNPAKALDAFSKAAEAGIDDAELSVALGHIQRKFGKLTDRAEGARLLKGLAEKQDPRAVAAFAINQYWGIGIRRDRQAAFTLLEKASAEGNVEATRQLLSIYRDGDGWRARRSLAKAADYLKKNRGQFDDSQYRRETLLIAAARARNAKQYAEIAQKILDMPPPAYLETLIALKNSNENAFIFFAQQQMKDYGYYKGSPDGWLDVETIEAFRKLCGQKGLSKKCQHGPLHDESVRTISVLIDPNRRQH